MTSHSNTINSEMQLYSSNIGLSYSQLFWGLMEKFLLVFEFMDQSVFKTINQIRNHLDITCRGNYDLQIAFNEKKNQLFKKHHLLGAPALINLNKKKTVYGSTLTRDAVKEIL